MHTEPPYLEPSPILHSSKSCWGSCAQNRQAVSSRGGVGGERGDPYSSVSLPNLSGSLQICTNKIATVGLKKEMGQGAY